MRKKWDEKSLKKGDAVRIKYHRRREAMKSQYEEEGPQTPVYEVEKLGGEEG